MSDRASCRPTRLSTTACLLLTAAMANTVSAEKVLYTNDNWFFNQVVEGSYTTIGPPPMQMSFGPTELEPDGTLSLMDVDMSKPFTGSITEPGFNVFINIITFAASAILAHNDIDIWGSLDFTVDGAVWQFTDSSIQTFEESTLLANQEFVFNGFEAGTDIPDLRLASNTQIRMTDSAGNLFTEYQYTAPVVVAGTYTVPAPSSLSFAALGVLVFNRRRRM